MYWKESHIPAQWRMDDTPEQERRWPDSPGELEGAGGQALARKDTVSGSRIRGLVGRKEVKLEGSEGRDTTVCREWRSSIHSFGICWEPGEADLPPRVEACRGQGLHFMRSLSFRAGK